MQTRISCDFLVIIQDEQRIFWKLCEGGPNEPACEPRHIRQIFGSKQPQRFCFGWCKAFYTLLQIIEKSCRIAVSGIHLVPNRRHSGFLQITCCERGFPRAWGTNNPDDWVLALLIEKFEQPFPCHRRVQTRASKLGKLWRFLRHLSLLPGPFSRTFYSIRGDQFL